MDARTDFLLTIHRAACQGPLPPHIRRLVRSATRNLERANADLYEAHHAPWEQTPHPHQLELVA